MADETIVLSTVVLSSVTQGCGAEATHITAATSRTTSRPAARASKHSKRTPPRNSSRWRGQRWPYLLARPTASQTRSPPAPGPWAPVGHAGLRCTGARNFSGLSAFVRPLLALREVLGEPGEIHHTSMTWEISCGQVQAASDSLDRLRVSVAGTQEGEFARRVSEPLDLASQVLHSAAHWIKVGTQQVQAAMRIAETLMSLVCEAVEIVAGIEDAFSRAIQCFRELIRLRTSIAQSFPFTRRSRRRWGR